MNPPKRQLIIPTSIDLVRIAPERIVYISSDGNYSTLVQADGEMRMLTFQLGQVEKMIADQLGYEGCGLIANPLWHNMKHSRLLFLII